MKDHQGFEIVGDDYAPPQAAAGGEYGTGYIERDYAEFPHNGMAFSAAPSIKRLTEQEIVEAVIEMTEKKLWATDIADAAGSIVKNQKSSSYCWIHAPVRAMEYAHLLTGAPPLVFSAFCAAYPIKHGSNQGGSGIQGVKSLVEHGTCIEELWPPLEFKKQETPEIKASKERHQLTHWQDLETNDKVLIYSSIIQRQLVTVGIPAWGHEVLLSFLAMSKPGSKDFGDIREGFDNSWGTSWGKNGRGVLEGAKRRFDEAGRIAAMEQSIA